MWNDLKNKLLLSLYIFILLAIFLGIFYAFQNMAEKNKEKVQPAKTENIVNLKIEEGLGLKEITSRLYDEKLIKSKIGFEAFSILSGTANKFLPGVYEISKDSLMVEIIKILTSGPEEIAITISPGMTLKEADEVLASSGIIQKEELINFDVKKINSKYLFLNKANSLEGFIFPDTYHFFRGTKIDNVVEKILVNFEAKVYPQIKDLRTFKKNDNLNWLILASLLEKEVSGLNDQKLVAGIILKRISKNMLLQVDATVVYAKCDGEFLNCPRLTANDFKIDSPYNTYKYKGWPPTPISNPSLQSIITALNPQNSDYLFYLSDPQTQKTIFSQTFEEHSAKRANYLFQDI